MADLIATCFGGRNWRCAKLFAQQPELGWEEIERVELKGQKLQGLPCLLEIWPVITQNRLQCRFPLFRMIHEISVERSRLPRDIVSLA